MPSRRIARLIKNRDYFNCEMCGKYKMAKMYEYQNFSYIGGHVPHHYKKICANCIYRECYGTKNWKKKKKEGVLDE